MNFVFRCFAEKRPGFDVEANKVFQELHEQLGIHGVLRTHVRRLL